jgi:PAS domain S-box-containing protein
MKNEKIKLLYIEDDLVDQMAFNRLVKEQSLPYEITLANSVKSAFESLKNDSFDIVISDFLLGDGTSFEFLPEIIHSGTPIILVTGTGDEDVAVKAIKLGASDYVIKDVDFGHLKMMPFIIESSIKKKQVEDKIKKLSMAVEQSPSMLFMTDENGLVDYINPRVTEITGYEPAELLGKNLLELHFTHNPDEKLREINEALANGGKWHGTACHARKSGELFYESTTISPIYNDDGQRKGYIEVCEDITEKKKAEEAIKKYSDELRESNASKDKMFSIIAHDLKTPFNGLMAFSDILSSDYDSLSKEEVLEYINVIGDLSRNTFNLLEKLLQWSRLQTGRMEFCPVKCDLHDLTETVINLLSANAKGKNIRLNSNIEKGLNIQADVNMITAVLRNLTSNAIKFTPQNGSVSINVLLVDENLAEISVCDTGVGIKENDLSKLFRVETQHSTKGTNGESGTGLGLLLCREFVERNGGKIRVESEPGHGSRFIFTLPLQSKAQMAVSEP